jgi:small conductance mechanosensitive channel
MFPFFAAEGTGLFADGRFLGKIVDEWIVDSQEFIRLKLPHLIVIAVIALVLIKLLGLITERMVRIAERHGGSAGNISEVHTLAGVVRATGLSIIALIAALQTLDTVGLNLSPLLASAGIAGVAIGLAAQTIVKDVLNGILILIEGQFHVGDTVRVAGLSGTVEAMTLRKTTVRDGDGTLYVVPNSQITTVANLSVGYSVATVNVSVDFSANPDEVVSLLTTIAMEVRNSKEFKHLFVTDPQVLGVDSVKGSQVIFPVIFKTLATQQYGPVREFQRRVRLALEEHHMLPGDPNRVFSNFGEEAVSVRGGRPEEAGKAADPTLLKPHETNPFSGE